MIRVLAAAAVLAAGSAGAQVTSYKTDKPVRLEGDPNKIVCMKEETIGSRLGERKVCMSVQQWNDKHKEHREFTEKIQGGVWVRE